MKSTIPLVTILTPTYNRSTEIIRLAKSLESQTSGNYQWLVIDDGSTDNTATTIKQARKTNRRIDYYKKQNGGKHTALNFSHKYIKGKYVCIVDSDDYLTHNAIEIIEQKITQYDSNKHIGCLSFQRGHTTKCPLNHFPNNDIISNHISFRINQQRTGDCFEVVRSSIFKKIKFPIYKNEKFMSEGYLWATIAKDYSTVYINKIIYICEYLEGGLTKTGRKLRIECPNGGMANSNAYLLAATKRKMNIKYKIKQAILYDCYSKFAKKNTKEAIENCKSRFLATICYPTGLFLYYYWKNKYGKNK